MQFAHHAAPSMISQRTKNDSWNSAPNKTIQKGRRFEAPLIFSVIKKIGRVNISDIFQKLFKLGKSAVRQ